MLAKIRFWGVWLTIAVLALYAASDPQGAGHALRGFISDGAGWLVGAVKAFVGGIFG